MTSEHARRIAQEVADGIFGAGASETQRLGGLAVSTINKLADELDAVKPSKVTQAEAPEADEADEPAPKKKSAPAQAHDRKAAKKT